MRKTSTYLILSCVLVFLGFGNVFAAPFEVSIGDYTVTEGDTTPVDIILSGFSGDTIDNFSFTILFDGAGLTASNASYSAAIGASGLGPTINPGSVSYFIGFPIIPALDTNLTVASFDLTGDVAALLAYDLTFSSSGFAFGSGITDLTSSVTPIDGTITVNAVPIPPTVLLLGAGLVGLVGIRRRVKS